MSISKTDLIVRDVLLPLERIPAVPQTHLLKQALAEMNQRRLGVTCIINDDHELLGIFTDGDIRRLLLKSQKPIAALFADDIIVHANRTPTTIAANTKLPDAIIIMEEKEVWDLPVVEPGTNILVGLLHLHPAIKAVMGL